MYCSAEHSNVVQLLSPFKSAHHCRRVCYGAAPVAPAYKDASAPAPAPGTKRRSHITDIANVSSSELNDGHKSQCDSPTRHQTSTKLLLSSNYLSTEGWHAATYPAPHHGARVPWSPPLHTQAATAVVYCVTVPLATYTTASSSTNETDQNMV